jgi:S-adenosylmethionine synthetase
LAIPKTPINFLVDSCGVISLIHEQSPDINQGVDRAEATQQGAGDQGIMFGYATNETENYMPLALDISHNIMRVLSDFRREKTANTLSTSRCQVASNA